MDGVVTLPRRGALAAAGVLAAWLWPPAVAAAVPTAVPAAVPAAVDGGFHALLVGVTRVAALPPRLWLHGPGNDVLLMRQALLSRGVAAGQIVVLAEGPAASLATSAPTRAAIGKAMAALLAAARPGDTVVLHLAGHGTQVPQRPDAQFPEPDGLDEAFLTADTQPWDATARQLPNALLDDDIGAWIDALVNRGAKVWAVFDTCHAAGMSRGDSSGRRWRSVTGAELGVPAAWAGDGHPRRPEPAARPLPLPLPLPAPPRTAPARDDGRVLAFAARGHEATAEEWLPRGAGLLRARMYGVFSHAVASSLLAGHSDLAGLRNAVQLRYAQDGRAIPVPTFIGPLSARLP